MYTNSSRSYLKMASGTPRRTNGTPWRTGGTPTAEYSPPALYLTLVTKGRFQKEPKKYINQMKKFMEKLHLKDKKVIFITPFRNTSDENVEESFYVKFELQVEYE